MLEGMKEEIAVSETTSITYSSLSIFSSPLLQGMTCLYLLQISPSTYARGPISSCLLRDVVCQIISVSFESTISLFLISYSH